LGWGGGQKEKETDRITCAACLPGRGKGGEKTGFERGENGVHFNEKRIRAKDKGRDNANYVGG